MENHFIESFEKTAKLKKMMTYGRKAQRKLGLRPGIGQEWLYHGTSKSNADKIMKEGLKSKPGTGISRFRGLDKANEGKVFLDKRKGNLGGASGYAVQQQLLEKENPLNGRLIRFAVPKAEYRRKAINPEVKKFLKNKMASKDEIKKLFGGNRVFKGEMPARYIDGSETVGKFLAKDLAAKGIAGAGVIGAGYIGIGKYDKLTNKNEKSK